MRRYIISAHETSLRDNSMARRTLPMFSGFVQPAHYVPRVATGEV